MSFAEMKSKTTERFQSAPIEDHPLFRALEADAVSREGAREIALQIFHVVDFFPRLLAALCARVDDHRSRMALVENLFEEHGRMDAARVHVVTYRDFLHALGIDDATIDASRSSIPVVVYTRAMFDVASRAPLGEALAVMGVVEEIVARVSPIVARYGRRHAASALGTHFALHEELDLAHADEIYELAAPHLRDAREDVLRGLAIGRYLQERLYSDLLDLARSVEADT
jgi:pyrroloquinoline quinone (PQQ) biosynthesis protein C